MERPEDLNEALVRTWYEAPAGNARALLDAGVVCHIPGSSPLAGTHRGPTALDALVRLLQERTGGSFRVDLRDLVTHDRHVIALVVASADRGGRRFESTQAHVFELGDGRIRSIRVLIEDVAVVDRLWN